MLNGVSTFTIIFACKIPVNTGFVQEFMVTYNSSGLQTMEFNSGTDHKLHFYINDGTNNINFASANNYDDNTWRVFAFVWSASIKTGVIYTGTETPTATNVLIVPPSFYSTTHKTPFGCYMTSGGAPSAYSRSTFSDICFFNTWLSNENLNGVAKYISDRIAIPYVKLVKQNERFYTYN